MPKIVIVGAGIIGASSAYHLARRGADVTLIDKVGPAAGATGVSWAWLNATHGNPRPYFDLRFHSMREWRNLQDQIGGRLKIDWCGSLVWEMPPDELIAFVHQHADWGYDIRLIDADATKVLEKKLLQYPETAAYAPCEGSLDPVDVTSVLIDSARQLGAKTLFGTEVTDLMTHGEKIVGVRTPDERIEADFVMLANGTGLGALCESVDVAMPLSPRAGVMSWLWTEKPLINHVMVNHDLMIRQLNPNVIIAEETRGHQPDLANPQAEGERVEALIHEQFSDAGAVKLVRTEVGTRPMPADRYPAQGFAPKIAGLYLAVMHSGVTLAASSGRFAAAEILDDANIEMLWPYRPSRFQN